MEERVLGVESTHVISTRFHAKQKYSLLLFMGPDRFITIVCTLKPAPSLLENSKPAD